MREEYDFINSVKYPYAKYLKKQVTLRLGVEFIDYFKNWLRKPGFLIRISLTCISKIVLIPGRN